jgi:peptide/nickel transport system permease protein
MAHASLRFGHKLITVGALSFLGLGVQPPASDWGSMLADGQPYMTRAAGLVLYPGLTIFITALAVTLIGQGLNARRSRQR